MAHKKETRIEGEIERGEGGRGEVWGLENEEGKGGWKAWSSIGYA